MDRRLSDSFFGDCASPVMPKPFEKAVGVFLVFATLLASLPQVIKLLKAKTSVGAVSYTHLRAHETLMNL
eukprot:3368747-Prymnesium_polylepis.1